MTSLIILVGILAAIVLIAEFLHKKKWLRGEFGRKFVHIFGSSLVAVSPFFISYRMIQILTLAAIIFFLVGRYSGAIKSIYDVDRLTWGDVLGAITIFFLALFQPNEWVFCAAILHVSLADGFAAVVGTTYGKKNRYKVFGQTKSLVGTATFYVISLAITTLVVAFDPHSYTLPLAIVLLMPPLATLVENAGVYGTDNVFVPILVAALLSYFQT